MLARACAEAADKPVYAIDPHIQLLGESASDDPDAVRRTFLANLARAGVDSRVRHLATVSVQAARDWQGARIRLLFVDGDHSREAVTADLIAWSPHLASEACIVFDDYVEMTSVREAVRDLAARKVIGGSSVLVGKMIAFGPREILRAVPLPTGAWTLARLNDRSLDTAVRLLAPG